MSSYLAFDYVAVQPTPFSPFHGGGKYGKIILQQILKKTGKVILFYSEGLPHEELDEICSEHPLVVKANLDCPSTWEEIFSNYNISCLYLPIPFSRLYKQYSDRFPSGLRIVGTIHGLRNLEAFPTIEAFLYKVPLKGFVRTMLEFAKTHIPGYVKKAQSVWTRLIETKNYEFFVVSNHTKNAVKSFLPQVDPCVFYSPSVVQTSFSNVTPKKKYFLLVSGNRWEKNNLRALRVLDKMLSAGKIANDFSVKITGVKNLSNYRYVFKNEKKIECLGYVPESQFSNLYAEAYALIYPSLSEGFGYPILEALIQNTPVIASKLTSIPEVGGDAALYFDPMSDSDIESCISKILNPIIYYELQAKAAYQYKKIYNRQQADLLRAVDFILRK